MTDKELDEWGVDFVRFYARFADVFRRKEPRAQAAKYLRGLMASVPRKNSWQVAEAVGDPIPDPMQRWLKAGVFEDMVHDLRMLMREIDDRLQEPRAAILDSRTLQSTPESGGCAGSDGHKRRKGSKVHMASACKSSNCPQSSVVLCCCRVAGSSNAAFAGWRASGVWCATMNAWRRR
jgi:hypothetical protein